MKPTERLLHEIDELREAQKSRTVRLEYMDSFDLMYMIELLKMARNEIIRLEKEVVKSGQAPIARTA
jgi:hypothetical protein